MPQFTTLEQYRNHILGNTKVALDKTIDEILDHLMEILDERIYNIPSGDYERTEMLRQRDNWIKDDYRSSGHIGTKLEFNESNYFANGLERIHGLIWADNNTELPSAEDFINVLNAEQNGLFGNIPNTEKFWDEFIQWVEDNYDLIFQANMKELGIDVKLY